MKKTIPWNLIIARLKDEYSSEEEALFNDWIARPENASLFNEIKLLWNKIQTETEEYNPDVSHYWKIMQTRINDKKKKQLWYNSDPFKIAATVACSILIVSLSYFYFDNQSDEIHTYSAMSGKSKIILPDSTVMWLNTGSTISYPGHFCRNRQIQLQGEASFDVKKDDKHPFVVFTSGIQVKVHGTHFNVNAYQDEENITVALERGSVSVNLNHKESLIKPGEIAIINKKNQSLTIEKADLQLELFWAKESVYFKSKPLGYICKYLEKWYNVKIEVDPEIAESQLYTFTVKDDSLDAILRIMSKINPIVYSFDERNQVKIMKVKL